MASVTPPGLAYEVEHDLANHRFTARVRGQLAVLDYQISPDNLIYLSYSRGYKSGGINPPLSVGSVSDSFKPESVDAFEIGSKNTFADGKLRHYELFRPAQAEPEAAPEVKGSGRHVMYVDDDQALVFLVTRALTRKGFTVT